MTGAAGALVVALVIAVLVVREAFLPPTGGRVLTPATLALLLVAGAVLAARALAVLG